MFAGTFSFTAKHKTSKDVNLTMKSDSTSQDCGHHLKLPLVKSPYKHNY